MSKISLIIRLIQTAVTTNRPKLSSILLDLFLCMIVMQVRPYSCYDIKTTYLFRLEQTMYGFTFHFNILLNVSGTVGRLKGVL